MKFLLMIYNNEEKWDALQAAEQGQILEQHGKLGGELAALKKFVDSRRLRPAGEGVAVRVQADGTRTVTDGPFSEAKEVSGGYYLVDCESMAEAIEWAKRIPARFGGIEVRQIWEMG